MFPIMSFNKTYANSYSRYNLNATNVYANEKLSYHKKHQQTHFANHVVHEMCASIKFKYQNINFKYIWYLKKIKFLTNSFFLNNYK